MFSDFIMKSKKSKTTKSKKSKKTTKKSKKSLDPADDSGIVLIDDDLEVDAERNWKSVRHSWKKHALRILAIRLNLYSF